MRPECGYELYSTLVVALILVEEQVHTAKAHAQIGTAPEEISHSSTTSNVATQPADICNGTLLSDIGQASLVGVLEGTNLLSSAQLALTLSNLIEDSVAIFIVLSLGLRNGQLLQFLFNGFSVSHRVEETSKESTLLAGDLCGWGVVGDGAVSDSPDVFGAVHNQVFVNCETATGVLLGGELVHKIANDRADGITGSPDQETVGNCFHFLGSIRLGDFGLDVLLSHVLNHGLGSNGDGLFLESRFRVVDQLLGEHRKDLVRLELPFAEER